MWEKKSVVGHHYGVISHNYIVVISVLATSKRTEELFFTQQKLSGLKISQSVLIWSIN